ALVGIISCRHHPIFRVLRHSDEFIVGMSGAHSEHRYGAHASREQEIAHRNPPCGSTPIRWEDFRQRVTAQPRRRAALTPRLAYEDTSGLPLHLTYLKPKAAIILFLRLMDCTHHFFAFVESTALDAAKHFDKPQNIERLLRE